jgi:hypothetical protein
MMEWVKNMSDGEKTKLMKVARKEGKTLRNQHILREKNVLRDILAETQNAKQPKKRRRKNKKASDQVPTREEDFEIERFQAGDELKRVLPSNRAFKENSYVAVAYQDN